MGIPVRLALIVYLISVILTLSSFHILAEKKEICDSPTCCSSAVRILEWMNPAADPCQDFYDFTCGGKARVTEEVSTMRTKVQEDLIELLQEQPKHKEPKPYRLLRKMFSMCMDNNTVFKREVDHATNLLEDAGGWPILQKDWSEKDWNLLETEVNLGKRALGGSLFRVYVDVDMKDRTRHMLYIDQPTFEVDREALLEGREHPLVQQYVEDMYKTAKDFGADKHNLNKSLAASLDFELALAELTRSKRERRVPRTLHNMYSLPQLQKEMSWLNWTRLISGVMPSTLSLQVDEPIIVKEPAYLSQLPLLMMEYPKETVANYMIGRAAHALRRNSPDETPRVEKCVKAISRSLKIALASMYARKIFDAETNQTALVMAKNIQRELLRDLEQITWLDQPTKERAMKKIEKIEFFTGYPPELLETKNVECYYKEFKMNTTSFLGAYHDGKEWSWKHNWERLRQPANRLDWRYEPYSYLMINAFYVPSENVILLTGPIIHRMQLFSAHNPSYINYGGLGSIIGHELIHAIDSYGSDYNENGEVENWWDAESRARFEERTKCMIDQYSTFNDTKYTKLKVNGTLTQGENIADNGAVELAYRAYLRAAQQLNQPEPLLPGLQHYSREQLFMLSFANFFCFIPDSERLALQIQYDPHSPAEFRIKGVAMNSVEFSKFFKCDINDPMNPSDKCEVW